MSTVRDLVPGELPTAERLLALSFDRDPGLRWLVPDDAHRARVGPVMARCWLRYGLRHGRVWVTDGLEGVAVRRPPGDEHLTVPRLLGCGAASLLAELGPMATARLLRAGLDADAVHVREMPGPHWYCWLLAVDPNRRGEGHARLLAEHTFAQADADGVPCWLESTNPDSVAAHRRLGWRVTQHAVLPGSDVPVFRMVRGADYQTNTGPATLSPSSPSATSSRLSA